MKRINYDEIFHFGEQFGRLTFIATAERTYSKNGMFICTCGAIKKISLYSVYKLLTQSCGCFHKEQTSSATIKHGMSKLRWYKSWSAMIDRCYGGSEKAAYTRMNYKDRGITVDSRWLDPMEFYKDMGDRPVGFTLDRVDVNGNYCKENCRWADNRTQAINKRKSGKFTTKYKGVSWCKRTQRYEVRCRDKLGKYRYLGMFKDPYQGYLKFKQFYFSEYGIELRDENCIYSGELKNSLEKLQ